MALLSSFGFKKIESTARGFDDRSTQATAKCVFVDSRDPKDRLVALFNPNELTISRQAEWGELNPIGWSSTTIQYSHTKSPEYSLSLEFSRIAMLERGVKYPDFKFARQFFQSFLYGAFPGRAPRFLTFVWPNTVMMTNAVKTVDVAYKRWSSRSELMAYGINLTLIEMRQTFLDRKGVFLESPDQLPDYSVTSVSQREASTGSSVKQGGSNGQ